MQHNEGETEDPEGVLGPQLACVNVDEELLGEAGDGQMPSWPAKVPMTPAMVTPEASRCASTLMVVEPDTLRQSFSGRRDPAYRTCPACSSTPVLAPDRPGLPPA